MKRKLIAIACAVVAIVASIAIFWFIVLPTLPIDTIILDIVSNPEACLNKRVRVNGTLRGPFFHFERKPPYNYALYDKYNRTIWIGVLGSGGAQEADPYVTLIGVVRVGLQGGDLVYYIEAEKAIVIAFPITIERISFYKSWIRNMTDSKCSYSYSNHTYDLRLRAARNDVWESVIIQQEGSYLMNNYETSLSLSEGELFFAAVARLGNWGFNGEKTAMETYMDKRVPVIKIGLAVCLEVNDEYQQTDSRQLCVDKLLFVAFRENGTTYVKDKDTLYWSTSADNDYHAQYYDRLLENDTWVDLNVDFGEILRDAFDYYGFEKGNVRYVQVYAEGVNAYCDLSVSYAHMYAFK